MDGQKEEISGHLPLVPARRDSSGRPDAGNATVHYNHTGAELVGAQTLNFSAEKGQYKGFAIPSRKVFVEPVCTTRSQAPAWELATRTIVRFESSHRRNSWSCRQLRLDGAERPRGTFPSWSLAARAVGTLWANLHRLHEPVYWEPASSRLPEKGSSRQSAYKTPPTRGSNRSRCPMRIV